MRQHRLQHVGMADQHYLPTARRRKGNRGQGAGLRGGHRLAARRRREAAEAVPGVPGRLPVQVVERGTCPRAKVDLVQPRIGQHRQAQPRSDGCCCLLRALHGAGQHGADRARGQGLGQRVGLRPALLAQRHARHAPGQHAAQQPMSGMPDQVQRGSQG